MAVVTRAGVAWCLFALLACQPAAAPDARSNATMVLANGPEITLPPPKLDGSMSLEAVLATRRSQRTFQPDALDDATIGQLLWAAQGLTDPASGHRTAPSAGALYPLTIYWADQRGLFRYEPVGHRLITVRPLDVRGALGRAGLHQEALRGAPGILVVVGDPQRLRTKYDTAADRFVAMECGHVAQNMLLQATALGLSAVPVGGLDAGVARAAIGHPASAATYYLIPVGRRRSS
jgi:SagB-type dehydrogenase family enzyme